MRANEFVIEGIGDWMDKQVAGRKQLDIKAAQKKYLKPMVKNLQFILAGRVAQFMAKSPENQSLRADELGALITKIISKGIGTNVDQAPFDDAMDLIKTTIERNPRDIEDNANIRNALTAIGQASFEQASDATGDDDEGGKYQAEIYDLPIKMDGDRDAVYAKHEDGHWSLWKKTGRNRLLFLNDIDPSEVHAVKRLITKSKIEGEIKTFIKQSGKHYATSTRLPD